MIEFWVLKTRSFSVPMLESAPEKYGFINNVPRLRLTNRVPRLRLRVSSITRTKFCG